MQKLKKQLGNIFLRKKERNDDRVPVDDDSDDNDDDDTSSDDDYALEQDLDFSQLDFAVFTQGISRGQCHIQSKENSLRS